MAYTSNPYAPKARRLAVNDVLYGRCTVTEAARKYGVVRSTVWKWMQRADADHRVFIQTNSSRPKKQAHELSPAVVQRIIELRITLKRCAPVIHEHLRLEGISISLSSVERTLRRQRLTRKRKPAKWYTPLSRPEAMTPGALVQMDTVHYVRPDKTRFYLYTVIDIYSRMAYAEYHLTLSQQKSFEVILHAQKYFGFSFSMMQTDNGPEFRDWLQLALGRNTIKIRHSRVRKPNDNAYIERFNRTIQEECFHGYLPNEKYIHARLRAYIVFYNTKRLHLSLNLKTPTQFVSKVLT